MFYKLFRTPCPAERAESTVECGGTQRPAGVERERDEGDTSVTRDISESEYEVRDGHMALFMYYALLSVCAQRASRTQSDLDGLWTPKVAKLTPSP